MKHGSQNETLNDREQKLSTARRLRECRVMAGYKTAASAFINYGWDGMTYLQHEDGIRAFGKEEAIRYARAFNVSYQWLMYGSDYND